VHVGVGPFRGAQAQRGGSRTSRSAPPAPTRGLAGSG